MASGAVVETLNVFGTELGVVDRLRLATTRGGSVGITDAQ
jgi:hypothetical protein